MFFEEKKQALNEIILAMKSVRDNLETEAADDAVRVNAEAMATLAEAYRKVSKG